MCRRSDTDALSWVAWCADNGKPAPISWYSGVLAEQLGTALVVAELVEASGV